MLCAEAIRFVTRRLNESHDGQFKRVLRIALAELPGAEAVFGYQIIPLATASSSFSLLMLVETTSVLTSQSCLIEDFFLDASQLWPKKQKPARGGA
ncbi:MAG: hypothetical protein ACKOUD_01475, partial [Rhodoluna sp.]